MNFVKTVLTSHAKIKYLLVTLVSLVVMDGVLTEALVGTGRARETNPLLAPLIGDIGFMLAKIAGSLLCAFILWDVYRRYPRLAMVATWIGVGAYSAIILWNTSLFILT